MTEAIQKLRIKYRFAMIVAALAVLVTFIINQAIMHDLMSDQSNLSDRIYDYKNVQLFLLSATFFILALIVHYIFRPMADHIARQIEQLEKTEAAACEANRLKSEFVATMSHEVRSPMTGVLGMAELLLRGNLKEDQRGYAQTIYKSGETLLNIIEDVLDFSKIEANKIELQNEPVDLVELLDELCFLYYPMAREKALELVVRYVPGSERYVMADPVRIRQIFGNLINNAIKFTDKGHIIITVQEDKKRKGNTAHLTFTVKDTGIGIPVNKHEDIFEIFQQADSSTTRNYGGTGLGLTICKRLVEMMGGEIKLTSAAGKGASFKIDLPLRRNHRAPYMPEKPFALQDIKTLIVDDLDILQKLLHEQLTLAGMNCQTANNGEDALQVLNSAADAGAPYDLVLIDYVMTGMNGEELAQKIKADDKMSNACLVMLSAAGSPLHRENFMQSGFSAYISKPFKNEELVGMIEGIWKAHKKGETYDWFISSLDPEKEANLDFTLKGVDVLLVEDSRLNQAYIKEVLESAGARVKAASHGQKAIEMLSGQNNYDVVLMDCQMPILDGFEAAKIIRKMEGDKGLANHLPIVALTANAMKGDRRKCLNAGMDDYLSKPVKASDLVDMVLKYTIKSSNSGAENVVPITKTNIQKNKNGMNEQTLKSLKNMFGVEYRDVIQMFLDDAADYLSTIKKALDDGDFDQAILPVHTLKSSGQRVGAEALARVAQDFEKHLMTGGRVQIDQLHDCVDEMEYEYKFVKSYLEKDLKNQSPRAGKT